MTDEIKIAIIRHLVGLNAPSPKDILDAIAEVVKGEE